MKSVLSTIFVFVIFQSAFTQPLWMRYPSISPDGSQIAFSYQGDLFVVSSKGGEAKQLTSHSAHDFHPIWSHDGSTIAFASDRHGNFDVYTTTPKGGAPKRLTFCSSNDIPTTFSFEDDKVLFTASRLDHHESAQFPSGVLHEVYEVPTNGGREKQFWTIAAEDLSYSTDGKTILFHNRKGYEDPWRKHHTSSVARDIVAYSTDNKQYTQITNWKGEDRNPIMQGNDLYFLSEKSGSFNIWKGTKDNPHQTQLTEYKDNPVRFLSASKDGILCFGFRGEIYTYQNGTAEKVNIQIHKDLSQNEKSIIPVQRMSEFEVSPDGKEVVFVYRGEVFVTSIDYSTTKQITFTAEQERSVSFSPDGDKILFAGERNESWNIYEVSRAKETEKHFYNSSLLKEEVLVENGEETFQPAYSPDGKEVAFLENRTTLKVINLKSKKERVVLDGKYNYSYSDGDQNFTWSPDSKWIAVQYFGANRWQTDIGLVKADGKEDPINLTQSGYGNWNPAFAMDGEMIYYETDRYGYRSHGGHGSHSNVEAIFLTEEAYQKFRLNKEEFEEWKEEEKEKEEKAEEEDDKKDDKEKDEEEEEAVAPLKIELDGIEDRKVRLTIHSSSLSHYLVNNDGTKLFYLTRFEKAFNLWVTDFKERETKELAKVGTWGSWMQFDKEQKNIFIQTRSGLSKYGTESGKPEPISFSAEMELDPAGERTYMFLHAWRQVREKFYVEDLHGVDWNMYREEYMRFLPYINNGYDFAEMLSEMLGELNASHTGARYWNRGAKYPDRTAFFGCYFDEEYEGDGLKIVEIMDKSPLDNKLNKIVAGVIIEKINGEEIKAGENYYPLLNRKTGKRLLLSLYNPNTKERWEESIKPISVWQQSNLAYERWVENCEKKVAELSDGKVGYVHIRGMNPSSYMELYDKALGKYNGAEALIVDTRFNGGGWLHDNLATFLSGKLYMSFEPRGQKNMGGEPISKWQKKSCVLMSEGNYSDAHLFPYTYKSLGIGKLIGMPVPGTGTAVWWERMIDGTVFGIPQVGMRSTTEGFLVENHDLEPDIKVNNEYEKFIKGEDQQLSTAVQEMLK